MLHSALSSQLNVVRMRQPNRTEGIQVIVTVLKICPSGPRALQSKKWLYKMLHRLVYNWIDLRNFLRYFAKPILTL